MFESRYIVLFMLCDLHVEHGQLSQLSEGTVTPETCQLNAYLSP